MFQETDYIIHDKCPFCQSRDLDKYKQRADQLWVLLCHNCRLGFVEKYPKNLAQWYDLEYYEKSTGQANSGIGYDNYQDVAYDYFLWAIALVALTKTKGSLFDLGCSNGLFLDLAKSYGCTDLGGVELTPEYAEIAQQKGYSVYNQSFLDIQFDANQKYDIVTAWAVLEHIPELNETLAKIKSILKPEGLLFFEVPCIVFDERDDYWLNSSLEHIYYFTEESFKTILKRHFNNCYIGGVFSLDGYGASLAGFVSNSPEKTIDYQPINDYLKSMTRVDLSTLSEVEIICYFIIHFRYTQNIEACKTIVDYLSQKETNSDQAVSLNLYYWSYLASNFLKAHLDNQNYIEAKDYFLEQISGLESNLENHQLSIKTLQQQLAEEVAEEAANYRKLYQELIRSNNQLEQVNHDLAQTQEQLHQTQGELHHTQEQLHHKQGELVQTQEQLYEKYHQIDQITHERNYWKSRVEAIETSKFWKLRDQWFKVRSLVGARNENLSFLQSLVTPLPPEQSNKQELLLDNNLALEESESSPIEVMTQEELEPIQETPVQRMTQEKWDQNLPLVSVIIPCYNYGQYLEEAIDSVLQQTFQNFEIIVVDDGSTDSKTQEVLDNLNKPKTTLIRQKNQGVAIARNEGIFQAKGKYICCLDADDKLKPAYLEKCLIKLETENLDICYTWIQEFEESDLVWKTASFELSKLLEENCLEVSAVFRRDIWEKVGGYDPQMAYEDWDLWITMAKMGAIGDVIPEPLFLYRKHGISKHDLDFSNHEEIKQKIETKHQKLYQEPDRVRAIEQAKPKYGVQDGYKNLLIQSENSPNEKRKTLLYALPFTVMGGVDTVLLTLMKNFKQQGFDIYVLTTLRPLTPKEDTTERYEEIVDGIYHFPNLLTEDKWPELVNYLIESKQIDLVLMAGSSYFYSLIPDLKDRYPNLKIVDQLYNEYGHIANNRKYADYIDLNIVENERVKTCLLDEYEEKPEKISLITNGVDINHFNPDFIEASNLPSLVIPPEKFVISYIGRFSEEKCPEVFVEIVNHFKNDHRLCFIMAGYGPMEDQIKDQIKTYGLEFRIHFPGIVETKPYLAITDLMILPSKIDGRPNIVLESLAMGIPVIASAIGGLPQIIQDGDNGFLCDPDNTEEFIEKIEKITSDTNLYQQMKQNARKYAVKSLDMAVMKTQYLELINRLI
ncbi:glycosyl transferase family 2 [Rippkaea orientalis PCC 8801]|uniref:Glycosyl transferase family 2 n=1 Tax=Rippkaea orientalis (strain PCC 8801 / RF-1) TaxID=41431 RepID=B7JW84_RIPO1|nr:glycosyltransferase [Rippkaea orientalis]ACK66929.1 glycosyl transferase family 2 [Rippkaea orientalis PCC 8801]